MRTGNGDTGDTTDTGDPGHTGHTGDSGDSGARRPEEASAAPGGLTDDAAAQLALIVGVVVLLVVFIAAQLLLDNTYGPLGEHGSAGRWAALGCGVVAGVVAVATTQWLALRSTVAVCVLLAAVVVAGGVLFPRPIDVSESFRPRPNERYACTGWTFRHYPPGTFDASSTTYCIGLEHRIADG